MKKRKPHRKSAIANYRVLRPLSRRYAAADLRLICSTWGLAYTVAGASSTWNCYVHPETSEAATVSVALAGQRTHRPALLVGVHHNVEAALLQARWLASVIDASEASIEIIGHKPPGFEEMLLNDPAAFVLGFVPRS